MAFLNFDVLMFIVVSLYDWHQSIQKYNWFLYANFITWDLAEFTYPRRVLGLCCIWSSFVIDFSGIPTQTIKSSINRDSFILTFQYVCLLFPSLAWLHSLKLASCCWMVVKHGHPCPSPTLRGHTQSFTINYHGRCWLVVATLDQIFWVLIMVACWLWSDAFSVPIDVIMWFSFFSLLR